MNVQQLALIWGVAEIVLALLRRSDRTASARKDRGSLLLLWLGIGLGIGGGIACRFVSSGRLPMPWRTTSLIATVLLVCGLALRIWAIVTLKKSFTVDVAVRPDQTIVQHGPYRLLRHPSYTGALLAFAGCALAFGNAYSFVAMIVPIFAAFAYRIAVEERALREGFGSAYDDYARRTKRLVPFVF
jgi:protein-S-isoprenylcysteine O-methyltransferase